MTPAVVALAVAMLAATGGLVALAFAAIAATKRAGTAEKSAAIAEHDLTTSQANTKTQTARADAEKARADALDAAIAKCAADAVGPVDGSFAELLQAAARARAAGGDAPATVRDAGDPSVASEADRRGPDDLLEPGQ